VRPVTAAAPPAFLSGRWKKPARAVGPKRPSGPTASEERKRKNGWACYGCWDEYQKRIGKLVFEFLSAEMGEFKWKFEF
jgi:hypothetical protein